MFLLVNLKQATLGMATVAAPPASFTAPRRASATGMRDLMGLRKSDVHDGESEEQVKNQGGRFLAFCDKPSRQTITQQLSQQT
jgi:hypothetical protein